MTLARMLDSELTELHKVIEPSTNGHDIVLGFSLSQVVDKFKGTLESIFATTRS